MQISKTRITRYGCYSSKRFLATGVRDKTFTFDKNLVSRKNSDSL